MSADTLTLVGYHGTLKDRANCIEREGFQASNKPIEWLGFGVYFFANWRNAEYWARQEFQRSGSKSNPPVVLTADINVGRDGFLDLDWPQSMEEFCRELEKLGRLMFSGGGKGAPNFKNDQERRCFWCNCYKQAHPQLQVIAYSFPCGSFNWFGFPDKRRQLCVMDDTCISMPPRRVEVKP